ENLMTQKASQPTAASVTPKEADRIRDIIFGPNSRVRTAAFSLCSAVTERLQQELDRMLAELTGQDAEQNKQLQAVRSDLRQELLTICAPKTARPLRHCIVRGGGSFLLGEGFSSTWVPHLKTGGSLADLAWRASCPVSNANPSARPAMAAWSETGHW
ncbi:hypothetical protein, partial [Candidatus Amarolinea dominans]|uniref:hypothetical protein n=1 Tax=Candidatus Amarolinea dominans TaxID=3140696 RepID=UPI003137051C|nr:hypothetical protein [Anaerolineae bacterium]